VANAVEALSPLNAISVDQLKSQLEEAKEKISEARANLLK
jgi:cellobiose-specific phosphotransferase system component IIA